jgi:hypothetical protein
MDWTVYKNFLHNDIELILTMICSQVLFAQAMHTNSNHCIT